MALNLAIETGASQLECLPTSYAELYTQCADPEKSYSSKEWMFMRWWAINQVGRKIGKASRKCFATFRKATGNVNSRQPKQTGLDLRTIFPSDTHIFFDYSVAVSFFMAPFTLPY